MNKYRTILVDKYSTWDFFFILWFVTEYCFYHALINTLGVILFIGISIIFAIKGKTHYNLIVPWLCMFILICGLNILLGYSISVSNSYDMIVSLLKDLLFLTALVGYVRGVGIERFKDRFVLGAFVSSIFMFILSVIYTGSLVVRNNSGLINANYLAVCGSIASIIIVSNDKEHLANKIWKLIYLTLFGILAGTRKAILALLIGIIVFFCAKYPKRLLKNTLISFAVLLTAYIALTRIPILYNALGYRFVTAFDFFNGQSGDSSIYMRSYYIQKGLSEFETSPIIGHGINCFKTLPGTLETYSHNNYVELLFSVGLVGTIGFYSIHLISIIRSILKRKNMDVANNCLCLAVLAIVLFVDYSMVSYYERGSLIYIVLFYMLLIQ